MKKLSFLNKFIFFINNIFALLFIVSFVIPYIPPKSFPLLSVLSLATPILILIHLLFILYWLLNGFKKQFFLSSFCILLAISFSHFPYKFKDTKSTSTNSFKVMNFNVRLFNLYDWFDDKEIPAKIDTFIEENDPDILAIQEYYPAKNSSFKYPYKYVKLKGKRKNFGQAIYSKYKIINKGSVDFKTSSNNAIFIDILKDKDTIRVYNIHLESFGIKAQNVDFTNFDEKKSKKLLQRLSNSFTKQQAQVEQFLQHKNKVNYKTIICGDFNNTAYSWAYRQIKGKLNDSFLEAGKGFGKTFSFNKYPLRIDFILVDPKFKINQHQNFEINLSDHEPILAILSE